MSYEEVRAITTMAGLFIFIVATVLVLFYVFARSNKKTFDDASRKPLDKDPDENTLRGNYGR
jgi:cytochrome c oxidase cbb3-type subunit IV